ncbi:MAG TPA: hypothetical protein DDY20_11040 [Desulfobulbaceae bacterium]|nr:hypothetical protein [Desulfobulbaceae bacterium]
MIFHGPIPQGKQKEKLVVGSLRKSGLSRSISRPLAGREENGTQLPMPKVKKASQDGTWPGMGPGGCSLAS